MSDLFIYTVGALFTFGFLRGLDNNESTLQDLFEAVFWPVTLGIFVGIILPRVLAEYVTIEDEEIK